ncbi:helix-turn-helix domain-containing protein (plasmid) [Campylobacter fetus subsp. venerealis bv. intermedius]|uniref:helix-turn-helix domain-containing protein n=1 Tax=Campylobacter fetus TaxID=196 RepID=UPI0003D8D4C3|nr:helix-turn-helix domain-containing protein [Campylobacter fetus]AHE95261.1 hypothetical protein CFVI03293_B0012 [Campylobacter fetus subsp. venerealis cfvi03/293]OCS23634.1 hypothetical protein CFVI9825_08210 [Campylobacter fetus subsp. venerealis cfvi9825]WKW28115.1 helix-turn-helix domain-containing protein [Campylobacter fetus subsp. venerealis bv. intermedius]WKW30241.1 helix-turn-helix domain-containing protein [Campylobacter fetus subsp. venerealis bv. intermedius]
MDLHNEVCEKLNISRKELADMLGISAATITNWSDDNRVSQTTKVALTLMLENHKLKEQLRKIKQGQEAINSIEI